MQMKSSAITIDAAHSGAAAAKHRLGTHDTVFALALFLLPFSLGEEVVVFSFGLPVLGLLSLYYLGRLSAGEVRVNRHLVGVLLLSSLSVVVMAVTSFIGENAWRSLSRVAVHLSGVLILWYFCSVKATPDERALARYRALLKTLARSGAIMASYYVLNLVFQASEHGLERVLSERWVGGLASLPWGASNTVAAALLIPLLACLQVLAEPSTVPATARRLPWFDLSRLEWVLYAAVISSGILATVSRNAIAVMIVLLAVFVLRRATTTILISVSVASVLLFASVDWELIFSVFEQRFYNPDIETLNQRVDIWTDYWDYIVRNPFSPIGYYNTLFVFGLSGHNFSLTTYVEQSLIGWSIAVALFVMLLRQALRLAGSAAGVDRVHGRFFVVGLLAIAVNLHLEDANFTHQYIVYWWVFVSLLCFRVSIMDAQSGPAARSAFRL